MAAGLFGYLGYDMVRQIEHLPDMPPDRLGLPDAILLRPTIVAIFDTVKDEIVVVTPVWPDAGVDARAAYARAAERIEDAVAALDKPLPPNAEAPADLPPESEIESNMTKAEYFSVVARAKDYIRAGDIFQVVPSQRFRRPFTLPPFLALSRAAAAEPLALSLLSVLSGLCDRGLQPGNPGPAARRQSDHPAHRRHAPARSRRRRRTPRWPRN